MLEPLLLCLLRFLYKKQQPTGKRDKMYHSTKTGQGLVSNFILSLKCIIVDVNMSWVAVNDVRLLLLDYLFGSQRSKRYLYQTLVLCNCLGMVS